jgi:ketosteroid isomerase-like protein
MLPADLPISFSPSNLEKLESIRSSRREVLVDLFQGDGAKDAARIAARFADAAVFQIGGMPPVTGRKSVEGLLAGFFGQSPFVALEHELLEVYDLDDALLWRANAVYRMPDGTAISTPYVNRVTFADGKCVDYRVHIDLSVLQPR